MRIGISLLSLGLLTACQTTAEHNCSLEGFEADTPEFRECVAAQRAEESVRMKKKAGQGLERGGRSW
jgi:hypothetical protein